MLIGIDPNQDHDQAAGDPSAPSAAPRVADSGVCWELARPTDPDVPPREHRLLRAVGEALKRRAQLDHAQQANLSAMEEAA